MKKNWYPQHWGIFFWKSTFYWFLTLKFLTHWNNLNLLHYLYSDRYRNELWEFCGKIFHWWDQTMSGRRSVWLPENLRPQSKKSGLVIFSCLNYIFKKLSKLRFCQTEYLLTNKNQNLQPLHSLSRGTFSESNKLSGQRQIQKGSKIFTEEHFNCFWLYKESIALL